MEIETRPCQVGGMLWWITITQHEWGYYARCPQWHAANHEEQQFGRPRIFPSILGQYPDPETAIQRAIYKTAEALAARKP